MRIEQYPGIAYNFGKRRGRRYEHRRAARHCFEWRQTEAFVERREGKSERA
jgi:hypothetical protein